VRGSRFGRGFGLDLKPTQRGHGCKEASWGDRFIGRRFVRWRLPCKHGVEAGGSRQGARDRACSAGRRADDVDDLPVVRGVAGAVAGMRPRAASLSEQDAVCLARVAVAIADRASDEIAIQEEGWNEVMAMNCPDTNCAAAVASSGAKASSFVPSNSLTRSHG
jgi:hypothetical protein